MEIYLIHGYLTIRTIEGGLINSYQIENIGDGLTLLHPSGDGIVNSSSLKFYFVPEENYQDSLKLRPIDVFSIKERDTVYNSSPKIYATYKGDSFQTYLYQGIEERISMDGRVGHLAASFKVSNDGIADSLKVIEGIDDAFNNRFLKVFNQAKKAWLPAKLHKQPVAVEMKIDLRFSTPAIAIPADDLARKANDAYKAKEYDIALYYYDLALEIQPFDRENLYRRGMCKMLLGNIP